MNMFVFLIVAILEAKEVDSDKFAVWNLFPKEQKSLEIVFKSSFSDTP